MRICFFGDSFVNGTGDDDCWGWPSRLCAEARQRGCDVTFYNLGIRRDTSGDVARRWEHEASARLLPEHDGRLVFSFGVNDCVHEQGLPRVSEKASVANTRTILARARARWPTLVVGPPCMRIPTKPAGHSGFFRCFGAAGSNLAGPSARYGGHHRGLKLTLSRHLLPLIPAALEVVQVLPAPDRITILTAPKPSSSACPLCSAVSSRVHSHYTCTLADLPWQGRAVTVQVRARRFRCGRAGCSRQVFAERLPEVAPSWARRTTRLGGIQRHIGFALGGEAWFESG